MLEASVNTIIRPGKCYDELLGELFFCTRHCPLGLQSSILLTPLANCPFCCSFSSGQNSRTAKVVPGNQQEGAIITETLSTPFHPGLYPATVGG